MTGQELLDKLVDSYQSAFDIERPFFINGDKYDAYACFNVSSTKYVLVKKAELWKADCYEHTFFKQKNTLTVKDLEQFKKEIEDYIEPKFVRKEQKYTQKDHMYTYITGIFIVEESLSTEVVKAIHKFKYFKNYLFGFRGYCEARLLVFDMKSRKVLGNRAAKDLVKGYKKTI